MSAEEISEISVPPQQIFVPDRYLIHSDRINDMINGREDEIIFATSYGLSFFNGSWVTWHHDPAIQDKTRDLLEDVILSVEYDYRGYLWIGFPGGIQIWNGSRFTTIEDAQLLKDLQIRDLQRWDDMMWIATGHSGIHRYYEGVWTWFQPFSKGGPNFYEVDSMVLDAQSDSLLVASLREGPWSVRDPGGNVRFISLADSSSPYYSLNHVRRDPEGGAFFFNENMVAHYQVSKGFETVLTRSDLAISSPEINDIAAGSDETLYIATKNGIYVWYDGAPRQIISGFYGIGESAIIRTLFIDSSGRLWFSGQGFVGYYLTESGYSPRILIQSPETVQTVPLPEGTSAVLPRQSLPDGTPSPAVKEPGPGSFLDVIGNAITDLQKAITHLFSPSSG